MEMTFEPIDITNSSSGDVDIAFEMISRDDPNLILAVASRTNLDFTLETATPFLFFTRIDFVESGQGAPAWDTVRIGQGDAFAEAALPVSDAQWFYREVNTTEIAPDTSTEIAPYVLANITQCTGGSAPGHKEGVINSGEDSAVLACLRTIRNRIVIGFGSAPIGANELLFLHGWVNDEKSQGVVFSNGATSKRVGYGTTLPSKGQLVFFHELAHNLGPYGNGLQHQAGIIENSVQGWDVGQRLPGVWPTPQGSEYTQRKQNYFLAMGHGQTHETWIGPTEYNDLTNYLTRPDLIALAKDPRFCDSENPNDGPVGVPCLLSNQISLSGALVASEPLQNAKVESIEVYRMQQLSWPAQPTYTYSDLSEEEWPFEMIFIGDDFQTLARIPLDARIAKYSEDVESSTFLGYFDVLVPESLVRQSTEIYISDNTTGSLGAFEGSIPYLTGDSLLKAYADRAILEPLFIDMTSP